MPGIKADMMRRDPMRRISAIAEIAMATMEKDSSIVRTNVGTIRGIKSEDANCYMFLGVPYGKVLENNPFGLSVPYPVFNTIFEANDDSAVSPQLEEFNNTIVGSLDCLRLNIHVPKSTNKKLPVMVWIHGGRFEFGFGGRYFYGPKYLMKHEVILITVNYRLGPYGFMCLNTPRIPGNQGFRDVLMALRWIKKNIKYFGGDVDNITICGHSAGAIMVETFLILEEDLFNKAILMSGTTLRPQVIKEAISYKTHPIILAAYLGFETDDCVLALEYLERIDPKLLVKAHINTGLRFGPCFDNKFDSIEQIIPRNFKNQPIAKSKQIPILIGNATAESMVRFYHKTQDFLEKWDVFKENLDKTFTFESNSQQNELEKIVKRFYIGDEKVGRNTIWKLTDFFSDFNFVYPIQKKIAILLRNGLNKIYYYVFSYNGERNFVKKKLKMGGGGVSHADDLAYIFDVSFESEVTTKDQLTIDRTTIMWTDFAKYGDPTPQLSELIPTKWLPVSEDTMHYLDIGDQLTAGTRPVHQRMAFWDLFFKIHQKYMK